MLNCCESNELTESFPVFIFYKQYTSTWIIIHYSSIASMLQMDSEWILYCNDIDLIHNLEKT